MPLQWIGPHVLCATAKPASAFLQACMAACSLRTRPIYCICERYLVLCFLPGCRGAWDFVILALHCVSHTPGRTFFFTSNFTAGINL